MTASAVRCGLLRVLRGSWSGPQRTAGRIARQPRSGMCCIDLVSVSLSLFVSLSIRLSVCMSVSPSLSFTQMLIKSTHIFPFFSPSQILLVGMGADEQLAGYARHRTRFQKEGWPGLIREVGGGILVVFCLYIRGFF